VSLNRPVAVKMILAGTYASAVQVARFRAEAEAAAALDHPHLLPIYEVGEHAGHQYFSMKLVGGGTLADRLHATPKPPLRELVGLLATVCRAVHFAHQRGVLHRDLKPGNILLDADGTPFVADFGLAKRTDSDDGSTRTGAAVGTPAYMPPEQARGDKGISTAADVYALGAILYEVLTGRPPFKGDTVYDTLKQVIEAEPADPRAVDPKADRDLSAIALKCLEKEPAKRYGTAAELADDLERWAAGEPTKARPPSLLGLGWRWVRRNALAAVLLPLLGVAWGLSLGLCLTALNPAALADPQDGLYLVPPNVPWYSPLRWLDEGRRSVSFRYVVAGSALVFTLFVGPLARRVARPRDGKAALGVAAGVGLLAMQAAALLVVPFAATEGRRSENRLHQLTTLEDLTQFATFDPPTAARLMREDLGRLRPYLRPYPGGNTAVGTEPFTEADRNWVVEAVRVWNKADNTNRTHQAAVGMSVSTLFGLVFFLGLSGFSMWAATLAARTGGWYRWTQIYCAFYGGGMIFTVPTAVFVLALVLVSSETDAKPFREMTPMYFTLCGLAAAIMAFAHRSAHRGWRWWVNDLVVLAWLAASAGVIALVGYLTL
jgi:hypothetical protein